MRSKSAAALLLLLLAGCGGADAASPKGSSESIVGPAPQAPTAPDAAAPNEAVPACDPLSPRTQPLALDVLPEIGPAPFVSVLESAQTSIRVMVYEMGAGPILDAIEAKAKAGVNVRVILDLSQKDVNQKYKDALEQAGATVLWSDPKFTYMHAKIIVVDDAHAVISTGNYYIGRMKTERNYVVVDNDPADVDVLDRIFDADFTGAEPSIDCTRLLVSPVNAKQRLLDFIASAKTELLVESMQFADGDVRSAIFARKAAGVDVRVILADPSWIDANTEAAAALSAKGIEARRLKAPAIHVKAIVADGDRAYVGSINLSSTSLTKNREVGLIVTEPANIAKVQTTFDTDWAAASGF
jgi:phosphatidylserine/phosphatidylglycerophosphate/cardiolipin synthase-like enzyme